MEMLFLNSSFKIFNTMKKERMCFESKGNPVLRLIINRILLVDCTMWRLRRSC